MNEIKRFPESKIEIEAMQELTDFVKNARFSILNASIEEVYQEDDPNIPAGEDMGVRIVFSGSFEIKRTVKKRDPWWVD